MSAPDRNFFSSKIIDLGKGNIRITRSLPESTIIPVVNPHRVMVRLGPKVGKRALPWLDGIRTFASGELIIDNFEDHNERRTWRIQHLDGDPLLREYYQNTNQLGFNLITLYKRGVEEILDLTEKTNEPLHTLLALSVEEVDILISGTNALGEELPDRKTYHKQSVQEKIETVKKLAKRAIEILSEFAATE